MASVVCTHNVMAEATGMCSVCYEQDIQIFKCDCLHWACEYCLTTIIDGLDGDCVTNCDNC